MKKGPFNFSGTVYHSFEKRPWIYRFEEEVEMLIVTMMNDYTYSQIAHHVLEKQILGINIPDNDILWL